mmetsp:Transcript_20359/g.38075  ORF Transcript_20359/g.38075 Transcript_20359/m.38075 type:complete len:156 (-) Transcript_20359:35-502(-)
MDFRRQTSRSNDNFILIRDNTLAELSSQRYTPEPEYTTKRLVLPPLNHLDPKLLIKRRDSLASLSTKSPSTESLGTFSDEPRQNAFSLPSLKQKIDSLIGFVDEDRRQDVNRQRKVRGEFRLIKETPRQKPKGKLDWLLVKRCQREMRRLEYPDN